MTDRCVVLLEKVLEDNARLRETLETRDAQHRRQLEELSLKITQTAESSTCPSDRTKSSRKRGRKVSVPRQCRQSFRKIYKTLLDNDAFQGFMIGQSFSSGVNRDVTKKVLEAVVADHGGVNKCPWSPAELKCAASTYFKSLNDAAVRKKKGKAEQHKQLCRRQGRMREKIQRRLASLETMPWSEEKKVQIERAIGSLEYTSSDESDLSEDENGVQKLSGYLVKKIPWERSALTRVKKSLDDAALKRLTPRARTNFLPRRGHTHQSDRQRPLDSLDWAVRPPPASNPPISSRAAETPLSSRSRAAETPLPSTRTASPVQTLTTASRLTPVGLTSSGTQPVSISRPKKKACRPTTSPEF